MSLRPRRGLVLVRPSVTTTPAGLVVPQNAHDAEWPAEGYVVAAGPPPHEWPRDVLAVGDHVHFGSHAGKRVHLDGQDLLIVRYADMLVVDG